MANKYKNKRFQATVERQRSRWEEFVLCETPGCRNVIAKWAMGRSKGYCSLCRRSR